MRNFIQIVEGLSEDAKKKKADAPVSTSAPHKDAEPVSGIKMGDATSKGELTTPNANRAPDVAGPRPGTVSRDGPARIRGGLDASHLNHLGALLGNRDLADMEADVPQIDPTVVPEPIPPTPQNLPAVIQTAMARTDAEEPGRPVFNPEWNMVKNLPGYMANPIRALGRMIFSQFTDTPIDQINVMATPINTDREVNMMAHWIRRYGIRDDEAEIDFSNIMPGYTADIQLWNSEGYTFLLVKDQMGNYIYSWPGGRGVHLDAPVDNPRLNESEVEEVEEGSFDDDDDDDLDVESDTGDSSDGYDISQALDEKRPKHNIQEGVSKFSDGEGRWYVQVSKNGHIMDTQGPFGEDEVDAVVSGLESTDEDPLGGDGSPWAGMDAAFRESRENDIKHILGQVHTHDALSNPWGIAFNEGDDPFSGNALTESVASVKIEPVSKEAMTEAQKFAILAGIGAAPKKAATPEAANMAREFAILAGIRR